MIGIAPLSSAEAPTGYPYKNSNNQKIKRPASTQHKETSAEERGIALHNYYSSYSTYKKSP